MDPSDSWPEHGRFEWEGVGARKAATPFFMPALFGLPESPMPSLFPGLSPGEVFSVAVKEKASFRSRFFHALRNRNWPGAPCLLNVSQAWAAMRPDPGLRCAEGRLGSHQPGGGVHVGHRFSVRDTQTKRFQHVAVGHTLVWSKPCGLFYRPVWGSYGDRAGSADRGGDDLEASQGGQRGSPLSGSRAPRRPIRDFPPKPGLV